MVLKTPITVNVKMCSLLKSLMQESSKFLQFTLNGDADSQIVLCIFVSEISANQQLDIYILGLYLPDNQ